MSPGDVELWTEESAVESLVGTRSRTAEHSVNCGHALRHSICCRGCCIVDSHDFGLMDAGLLRRCWFRRSTFDHVVVVYVAIVVVIVVFHLNKQTALFTDWRTKRVHSLSLHLQFLL